MQAEKSNYRFRGYRLSRPLVQFEKAAVSDLTRIGLDTLVLDTESDVLEGSLDALLEEQVSQLQHLRAQLRYRLARPR